MNLGARVLGWMFAVLLLTLPVVAVMQGLIGKEHWPLRVLVLQAPFELVGESSIRAAAVPHASGGFFEVDSAAVRMAVAALPWVEHVEVRKLWPDRLLIRLREHQPYAHWRDGRLLAANGRLIAAPPSISLDLPHFDAADDHAATVLSFHRELVPLLSAADLDLHSLRLSDRGAWSLTTGTGLEIELGRHDVRPRLARFVRLLPGLQQTGWDRVLRRADLRYPNGFALSFATENAAANSAAIPGAPAI